MSKIFLINMSKIQFFFQVKIVEPLFLLYFCILQLLTLSIYACTPLNRKHLKRIHLNKMQIFISNSNFVHTVFAEKPTIHLYSSMLIILAIKQPVKAKTVITIHLEVMAIRPEVGGQVLLEDFWPNPIHEKHGAKCALPAGGL